MPIRIEDIPNVQHVRLHQATMDPGAAGAPGRALEGLARDIASVSKPFADIANRLQDVKNADTEMRIRTAWDQGRSALREHLAEKAGGADFLQRVDAFSKESSAMLEAAGVPPEVRDRLRPDQRRMLHDMKIHGAEQASRQILAQSRAAFQQRVDLAVEDEDDGAINREVDAATARHIVPAAEAEQIRAQAQTARADQRVMADLKDDPGGWIRANAAPNREAPDFDEVKHANRMATARVLHAGKTLEIYHTAARGIAEGALTLPARIVELTAGLHPAVGGALEAMLREKAAPVRDDTRPRQEVQHQLAGDIAARLLDYRADGEDYDGDLIRMADGIRRMDDGPLKASYEGNLRDALTGTRRPPATNAEYFRHSIDDAWRNHGFGRVQAPVRRIDVGPLIARGLLRDRERLAQAGLGKADIDYVSGSRADGNASGGGQAAADDDVRLARFAERYASVARKPEVADPFLRAVFTTLGAGRTVMDYADPAETEAAEPKNAAARTRYGAALTSYTGWVQRNPHADGQAVEAAARQAIMTGAWQVAAAAASERARSAVPPHRTA
ncbi:MAG: hypothetical protein EOO72_01640 [Myxococcaceae bacterium]|nr:MAG: hypothetical protein EOO72_01640 [Myxococcaceae bacterium]